MIGIIEDTIEVETTDPTLANAAVCSLVFVSTGT